MRKQLALRYVFVAALAILVIGLAACAGPEPGPSSHIESEQSASANPSANPGVNPSTSPGIDPGAEPAAGPDGPIIQIMGDGIDGSVVFSLAEMLDWPGAAYEHIYSTINNWPSARFYAGRGISVAAVLEAAGVIDSFQSATFRSYDSYEVTLTRRQLLEDRQYYFPQVAEGSSVNAEEVKPVIAYEFKEGSSDLAQAAQATTDSFCLIIGQRNHLEHTNPAFVENLAEIIVSAETPEQWAPAAIFPFSGRIAIGESIKLQHPEFGLVKMFYTLDGSEPTELSAMYNPSTYQPELNKPIMLEENTILKVLVTGFGREDSPIAMFEIEVQ